MSGYIVITGCLLTGRVNISSRITIVHYVLQQSDKGSKTMHISLHPNHHHPPISFPARSLPPISPCRSDQRLAASTSRTPAALKVITVAFMTSTPLTAPIGDPSEPLLSSPSNQSAFHTHYRNNQLPLRISPSTQSSPLVSPPSFVSAHASDAKATPST